MILYVASKIFSHFTGGAFVRSAFLVENSYELGIKKRVEGVSLQIVYGIYICSSILVYYSIVYIYIRSIQYGIHSYLS